MLEKDIDLTSMSAKEILDSLVVSEVGDYRDGELQPLIISVIISDGTSFYTNLSTQDGETLNRLHYPFSAIYMSSSKPTNEFMVGDLKEQTGLLFESYFNEITWEGQPLLTQCFALELGETQVFELEDENSTAIIPMTASLRKTTSITIKDENIRKIIIEDIIEEVGDNIDSWEPFSIQLVEQLVFGAIHIPAEWFSVEADEEELGYLEG